MRTITSRLCVETTTRSRNTKFCLSARWAITTPDASTTVPVLSRHGLGYLVGMGGLERWVTFEHGLLGHEQRDLPYTRPEHLRSVLEEPGATLIKLGRSCQ